MNEIKRKMRKIMIWITTIMAITLCAMCICSAGAKEQSSEAQHKNQKFSSETLIGRIEILEENENEMISKALYEKSIDIGKVSATAYCKCNVCCGKWSEVKGTYTGTEPTEGVTIAVDPKVIPLGSIVFVDMGDGDIREYVAEDIGGAIKGNKIDIYHDTHDAAREFGMKTVNVKYVPAGE